MLLAKQVCRRPSRPLLAAARSFGPRVTPMSTLVRGDGEDVTSTREQQTPQQSPGAWLQDALARTPVNDLSDQKTYSKYRHPTVGFET